VRETSQKAVFTDTSFRSSKSNSSEVDFNGWHTKWSFRSPFR